MGAADLAFKVAGKAADAAATAHGVPVPGVAGVVVEGLLRDLLAVQDEQAERLKRIEANVDQLLHGPWRIAQLHLREALLPGRTPDQQVRSLRLAAEQLRTTLSIEAEHRPSRAYVAFDLAVVLAILGDLPTSRMYGRESLRTATDALRDADHQWQDKHSRYTLGAGLKKFTRRVITDPAPGSVALGTLALRWYQLALAVERLTDERAFVTAERDRAWCPHHWMVQLLADGDDYSLRIVDAYKHRTSNFSPPVTLPAWTPGDLPQLPQWWPREIPQLPDGEPYANDVEH